MPRLSLRCLLPLLLAIAALGTSSRVSAQTVIADTAPVLVYRVQFTGVLSSLNFRGFSGGYYIADVNNGASDSGALILLQLIGNARRYYTLNNFGQLFFATDGRNPQAFVVGSTTSVGAVSAPATRTITFFVNSEAKDQVKLNLELSNSPANFFIPKQLKGQAIFCDSQEDQPYVLAPGQASGTAAQVNVSFQYDEGQSVYSLKRNVGRSSMVAKIISELKKDKYTQGN